MKESEKTYREYYFDKDGNFNTEGDNYQDPKHNGFKVVFSCYCYSDEHAKERFNNWKQIHK